MRIDPTEPHDGAGVGRVAPPDGREQPAKAANPTNEIGRCHGTTTLLRHGHVPTDNDNRVSGRTAVGPWSGK